MKISPALIEGITIEDGRYSLPSRISGAIEDSFECDNVDKIKKEYDENLFQVFQDYITKLVPVPIKYNGLLTLDAYTAFYFGRNFCIPFVGLRDLAYHSMFQNIPSKLNILDIGSGTGAVVLGLLWMFCQEPLSAISVNITAIDSCQEALERQRDIIRAAGFDLGHVKLYESNINNTDSCINTIKRDGPYDLIFSGNCLTETPESDIHSIVQRLPETLADNGAIIIAEAQRNYSKMLIKNLIAMVPSWGLHVYYPCTGGDHPYGREYYNYCMVWRDHECAVPEIKVNGSQLSADRIDTLTACWLILTKHDVSIYDSCRRDSSNLKWGPISVAYEDRKFNEHRSICSCGQELVLKDDGLFIRYKRGHIVGLSDAGEVEKHYNI